FFSATWNLIYTDVAKEITDVFRKLEKDEANNQGKIAQARIVRAVNYLRLTQMYGDVPYFDAGKAAEDSKYYFPKYDRQEDILKHIIKELEEARDQLDNNTFASGGDIYYTGNISKWKKLANSLIMRTAMLMAETSQSDFARISFEKAAKNPYGYISSVDEAAKVVHDTPGGSWGTNQNGYGTPVNGKVGGLGYATIEEKPLKMMQRDEDPRIFWMLCQLRHNGSEYVAVEPELYKNYNPFALAEEAGEPFKPVHLRGTRESSTTEARNGIYVQRSKDEKGEMKDAVVKFNYFIDNKLFNDTIAGYKVNPLEQLKTMAYVNPHTIGNIVAPSIVFAPDETYFLLAEAAQRGWNAGISAKEAYGKALKEACMKYPNFLSSLPGADIAQKQMKAYAEYTGKAYVYEAEVDKYIGRKLAKYDASSNKLEEIVTQHWLSNFDRGYEAFTIYNRTHYPSFVKPVIEESKRITTLPIYNMSQIAKMDFDDPIGTKENIVRHSGGDTEFVRPTRFTYPSGEVDSNEECKKAIQRQAKEYGYAQGKTGQLILNQWISKKK
ncbi:MAG: SusD/RagB family nutrient-binding outer membrane lipoprotein, partial [Cytophagales bacterium]|nr:SusD/RagB family nutrient-binding outer membrane lipoprotein [Cytophagales bacterium]